MSTQDKLERRRKSRREHYHRNKKHYREYALVFTRTLKGRYSSAKAIAKRTRRKFQISVKKYASIISQPCNYCGRHLNETGLGLDRIDSTKDYVLNNVVPCCKFCNQAKNNLTVTEFKQWIQEVYENFVRKKC